MMSPTQQGPRRGDVWWHVYPLGAVGAPIRERSGADALGSGDVVHRLERLLPWVDHAADLGCTGLQLGPVFASATHGYDTLDHDAVDPRLGDRADLLRLVDAAHARGLRVILDGVVNHVSADHPLHRRALAEGPGSDAARYFRVDWDAPGGPRAACFEGHESLVTLNHDAPEVADLVTGVLTRWLDAGIDGWRLDAAYAVPSAFWARVLPRVRAAHPDVTLVGEVIHGDYPGFVAATARPAAPGDVAPVRGLDGVTQYELWKAIWSSFVDRNLFELAWAMDRHDAFVAAFAPMTFVGNHDVTRIATRVGDLGPAGAALAATVLLTVGGEPSLYYGDEVGLGGVKEDRLGGDDAVRPALPATPDDLVAAAGPDGAWLLDVHRALVALRRRQPWLAGARTENVALENEAMTYRVVERDESGQDGPRALEVTIDLRGEPAAWARGAGEDLTVRR